MLVESVLPLIGQTGGTIQGDRNRATATGRPQQGDRTGLLKWNHPASLFRTLFLTQSAICM